MWDSLKSNPFHALLGLMQVGIGLHLISHDSYFVWPPFVAGVANDDIVGGVFVLVGLSIMYWVFDRQRSVRFDHALLIISAGIMTTLTFYQWLHYIVLGIEMPWISNAALTGVILILAERSDSSD